MASALFVTSSLGRVHKFIPRTIATIDAVDHTQHGHSGAKRMHGPVIF